MVSARLSKMPSKLHVNMLHVDNAHGFIMPAYQAIIGGYTRRGKILDTTKEVHAIKDIMR
jgi:hypothetical protein